MATFADGEGGLSVRTKINAVLQHADGTSGELVINDAGADVDFRVESDTNANALFVDGATGNVVVGSATPVLGTANRGNITVTGSASSVISLGTSSAAYSYFYHDANGSEIWNNQNTYLRFATNNQERMRISAAGNVGIGTTNPGGIFAIGEFSATGATQGLRVSDTGRLHDTSTNSATTVSHYRFYNTNGQVGAIVTDGTATAYNTSSDYRLKEDIQPVADATGRLMELKPVNFAWKADGSRTDGFIAHEVQAVVPQAVTGEKDGDDMQQMDHSKLVPLLTAALQKAIQQIELLEARLDAANL